MTSKDQTIEIIRRVAGEMGYPATLLLGIAEIESSTRAHVRTGSYKGLFMLDDEQFKKHLPTGTDIYDPEQNTKAAIVLFLGEARSFRKAAGYEPSEFDIYMTHQQGLSGYLSHLRNPLQPAWLSFQQASKWPAPKAKSAIWGNMTPYWKAKYGSVEAVTSKAFIDAWRERAMKVGIRSIDRPEDDILGSIEEQNRKRPDFFRGTIDFFERIYRYGTGKSGATGDDMKRGSIPFGTFLIEEGLHYGKNQTLAGNSFRIRDMFDPKWQLTRSGMLFHKAQDDTLLRSSGCIVIAASQWSAFRAQMLKEQKARGQLAVTIAYDGTVTIKEAA